MSSSHPDYYKILQIRPSASPEVIEAVYRQLARIYHPDRNVHRDTTDRMQAINIAYGVLRDPQKRLEYDLSLVGNFVRLEPSVSMIDWAITRWAQMGWHSRLSLVCVFLSIFCLVGISNNLVQRQILTSTHMAVSATVVSMQMNQAIVETVVATQTEPVIEPQTLTTLFDNEEHLLGKSRVNYSNAKIAPVATVIPEGLEARQVNVLRPIDANAKAFKQVNTSAIIANMPVVPHIRDNDIGSHRPSLTEVSSLKGVTDKFIGTSLNSLLGELIERSASMSGIIQTHTHPYYRRLDLLPREDSPFPLSNPNSGVTN